MKLNKLFFALAALVFAATACEKDAPTSLGNIQVSKTYISIPAAGGSAETIISSSEPWAFIKNIVIGKDSDKKDIFSELPTWLTASAIKGEAGETKVTFTAPAIDGGREQQIGISCGAYTQYIIVRQGEMKAVKATCADVFAGADGKTYTVTGTCTSIANTSYGNWYLNDGTTEDDVYIYGTVDGTGSYNWASFNIEVGDVVTVSGPKTTYNGTTVELVDALFVSVKKSLLKVNTDSFICPREGGEIVVRAAYKGSGTTVEIPDDSFITIKKMEYRAGVATKLEKNPADTTIYSFQVAENPGTKARSTEFKILSSKGGDSSSAKITVSQDGASGTLEMPFTVEDAIKFALKLSAATTDNYYVKGIVTKVKDQFSTKYGNATFWISDDGTCSVSEDGKSTSDKSHDFEGYQVLWLDNASWTEGQATISVGDEVIICGQLTNYNGLAETNQKKAYIYAINGCTVAGGGAGSEACPFNIRGAISAATGNFLNANKDYYVAGTITKIKDQFSTKYGNATFWLSDDGTHFVSEDGKSTSDKTHDFEAYQVLWLNNASWTEGQPTVSEGDKVVICGKLANYNGLAETSSKKAYVYSYTPKNPAN